MMIITDCPRCGRDFMFDPRNHQSLIRFDKKENDYIICQDCDQKEKVLAAATEMSKHMNHTIGYWVKAINKAFKSVRDFKRAVDKLQIKTGK